eukprot:471373_1
MNKAMQEKDDDIIARELEKQEREHVSAEIINATLDQNQKLLIQKSKLQQMLQIKDDEIDKVWDRLHGYVQCKRDENDPDFVWMEQTGLKLNENEQKEETQLIAKGIILYKINSYVFSAQAAAIKKYRRWRVEVIGMAGALLSFGVVANVQPKSIKVILHCYLKPLNVDASQILVPSAQIIRHWSKHHLQVLNKLSINFRLSMIGKKEILTGQHDESSLLSSQFDVLAVSYKNAYEIVNKNNQLLDNNEEEKIDESKQMDELKQIENE